MHYIQIIHRKSGDIVKQMEASSQQQAEQIEGGIRININHADYITKITTKKGKVKK